MELARVDLEHIEWRPDGLLIKIPYSKTNKSGEPEMIGTPKFVGDPLGPVAALAAWVHHAKIKGAVFVALSPVAGKGGRRTAPLDISCWLLRDRGKGRAARHLAQPLSLRRGVVTSAEAAGRRAVTDAAADR